jgi:hypothetical protein
VSMEDAQATIETAGQFINCIAALIEPGGSA